MFSRFSHEDCELHTVLRLPNGTFSPYSPGTKTNVIFFTKGYPTENVWIYDARTNVPRITKKDRPLTPEHFAEFESCFGPDPNGRSKRDATDSKENRWRSFHITEIKERDFKIDSLKWLKDESLDDGEELPEPEELAADAIAELEAAVEELTAVISLLENGNRGCDTHNSAKNADDDDNTKPSEMTRNLSDDEIDRSARRLDMSTRWRMSAEINGSGLHQARELGPLTVSYCCRWQRYINGRTRFSQDLTYYS